MEVLTVVVTLCANIISGILSTVITSHLCGARICYCSISNIVIHCFEALDYVKKRYPLRYSFFGLRLTFIYQSDFFYVEPLTNKSSLEPIVLVLVAVI